VDQQQCEDGPLLGRTEVDLGAVAVDDEWSERPELHDGQSTTP
jgi:hypothetical protein